MKRFKILGHLLLMFSISVSALFGTIYGLKVYTRQDETIAVPPMKGMQINEAIKLLSALSLKIEVIDSIYQYDQEKHAIYDVIPVEGSKIKKDRTIYVRIYSQTPSKKVLPELADLPIRVAYERLRRLGFQNITEKEVEGIHKGLCVGVENDREQLLEPGQPISVEQELVLLVSGKDHTNASIDDFISRPDSISDQNQFNENPKKDSSQSTQPENWF